MPGWDQSGREAADAQASTAIDVDAFETAEELETSLGMLLRTHTHLSAICMPLESHNNITCTL